MNGNLDLAHFRLLLHGAAKLIQEKEAELTAIDGKFGDGDHGITMSKVAEVILQNLGVEDETISECCDRLGMDMLFVNGGSSSSLWGTFFQGFGMASIGAELDASGLKQLLRSGLDSLCEVTTARVGDKTMMDALIPAVEGAETTEGTLHDVLYAACVGAEAGRERSREFVSRHGRARSYGKQTIGTPDAGAVSMAYFFRGLLDTYENTNT